MLKMVSFWVLMRVFLASDGSRTGHSARVRPYWTDLSLSDRQFPSDQMEVGQGELGEEMGRVLGKTPVPDLSIAPQVLDDTKGMFDSCSYAIALSVELPVRAVEAPAPIRLAMHPPYDAFFFSSVSSTFVRIGLVAVDRLLMCLADRPPPPLRRGPRRAWPPRCAPVPSDRCPRGPSCQNARCCPSSRKAILRVPFPLLVLGRRRRMDDRRIHDRAFAHHHAPIRQIALCLVEQRFGSVHGLPERWRNLQIVVSSGTPFISTPAKRRIDSTS